MPLLSQQIDVQENQSQCTEGAHEEPQLLTQGVAVSCDIATEKAQVPSQLPPDSPTVKPDSPVNVFTPVSSLPSLNELPASLPAMPQEAREVILSLDEGDSALNKPEMEVLNSYPDFETIDCKSDKPAQPESPQSIRSKSESSVLKEQPLFEPEL